MAEGNSLFFAFFFSLLKNVEIIFILFLAWVALFRRGLPHYLSKMLSARALCRPCSPRGLVLQNVTCRFRSCAGCVRTALECSKLLLSWDPLDPLDVLLTVSREICCCFVPLFFVLFEPKLPEQNFPKKTKCDRNNQLKAC